MVELDNRMGLHCISFIENLCVHTIGPLAGKPFLLDQWQKDFIIEMFLLAWIADVPHFVYQSILLMVPRGAGKSSLAAAISLFKLSPASGENAPRVLLAAATRENAKQVYSPAMDMVHLSPRLADMMQANKNLITCESNRGELVRISSEGKSNFGHLSSWTVRDELHTWITDKQVQLSEALMTALMKRPNSQCLSTSTAGYDLNTTLGELYTLSMKSPLLESPREGLSIVKDRAGHFLAWMYEAPSNLPIDDPATWRIAQPATWIDEDAIGAQLSDPSIGQDEFRRQMLGQWTATKSSWFDLGVWQQLASNTEIPLHARIQVGIDASITKDTTAVSWAWAPDDSAPVVVRAKVWSANPDTPHHVFIPGGRIRLDLIRDFIVEDLAKKFVLTEIVYDPRFAEGLADELSDAGFTVVPFIQSSAPMADAYNVFYSAVREGNLTHDGDLVLAEHVDSTGAVQGERGWAVFKLKQTKKIDACVAAVMAHARAKADLKRRNRSYIYIGDREKKTENV